MVWATTSWSSTTSTPRWVILLTKSAWSRCAFSTHITSSKSSSWLLLGVSRLWARPGEQTSTLRRRPTSECTPYVEETLSFMSVAFLMGSDLDAAGPEADDAGDAAGHDEDEQPDLGRGEQTSTVLAPRLDVEQRGRRAAARSSAAGT